MDGLEWDMTCSAVGQVGGVPIGPSPGLRRWAFSPPVIMYQISGECPRTVTFIREHSSLQCIHLHRRLVSLFDASDGLNLHANVLLVLTLPVRQPSVLGDHRI